MPSFLLRKLPEKIFSPVGVAGCLLLAIALSRKASPARQRRLAALGFVVLVLPSLPICSTLLMRTLESTYPPAALSDVKPASTIVVLGGTTAPQWGESYLAEELAGSRLLTAARLYRLGKAPKVLVSSGVLHPSSDGTRHPEAVDMKNILVELGVPAERVLTEANSLNTSENARFCAQLLQSERDIILVTSAYHLPRAAGWFRLAGFAVAPIGSGRTVRPERYESLDFLPSAAALSRSSSAIKEWIAVLPLLWSRNT